MNDSVNPIAFCELLDVIRHVLDIKNLGLKWEPSGDAIETWEIVCFGSSDHAGDLISRRNIGGFIPVCLR